MASAESSPAQSAAGKYPASAGLCFVCNVQSLQANEPQRKLQMVQPVPKVLELVKSLLLAMAMRCLTRSCCKCTTVSAAVDNGRQ